MDEKKALRTIVGVGGFVSNSGKTTLVCRLLEEFSGWEAIKLSRGHYRSCGKDPQACCISPLLGDEPLVRSGRAETYTAGKDTGRYWDAGASNVHWVIASDAQVEEGIRRALERVEAPGVFVEGNSNLKYIDADFVLVAARSVAGRVKPSARRVLKQRSALYLFDEGTEVAIARRRFLEWLDATGQTSLVEGLPLWTREDWPALVERVREIHEARLRPRAEVSCSV